MIEKFPNVNLHLAYFWPVQPFLTIFSKWCLYNNNNNNNLLISSAHLYMTMIRCAFLKYILYERIEET